jgi:KDO2-lipid IV(A) lauroyltransferase
MARTLARLQPECGPGERARFLDEVFERFAMCFADLLSTNRAGGPLDRWVRAVEGTERVDRAVAGGRGLVVLTAHLGNWELGGRLLAARLRRPTHVVMAPEADPGLDRVLRRPGEALDHRTLRSPTDALALVAALRRGEIVALQGDRALGDGHDVAVDLFGAPALLPVGPFVLARAAGVKVLPAFCALGDDLRYLVIVAEPIGVGAGGEEEALAAWARTLQDVVRRFPTQWFNFYDVWRAGPAG